MKNRIVRLFVLLAFFVIGIQLLQSFWLGYGMTLEQVTAVCETAPVSVGIFI
jgi:hypothetical protein